MNTIKKAENKMRKILDRITAKSVEINGKKRGFTMVELLLVILIGGILIVAGVQGYNKIYLPTQADAEVKKITFVLGGIERVKNNFNKGAYQGKARGTIKTNLSLTNALGGATGINDVGEWTYACTAGGAQTITIVTSNYDNLTKAQMIVAGVNNNLSPWVATLTGTGVTVTKANSTCTNLL